MKSKILVLLTIYFLAALSCKKDSVSPENDEALYKEITQGGYSYYVGTPTITAGAGNSPHGFERVKFNSIAQSALDSTGKLPAGNSFPSGSVIVKEVYSSASGSINLYAVMKKDPENAVSGNGFLWAEFKTDGSASFSTGKKGDGCIGCHSSSTNRDLVRIFDLR